jgi:hypothetical protein
VVVNSTKTNTTIGKKGICWFGSFIKIEKTRKTKVRSQLINSPKYFQGEPHVQWYSMNKDELDDGEMVVGMPKVHVLNSKAYLLDPPM